MSENGPNLWQELKTTFKFLLAKLAIKWCGLETLYWSAPLEWEEYMKIGEPLTPRVFHQKEEAVHLPIVTDAKKRRG